MAHSSFPPITVPPAPTPLARHRTPSRPGSRARRVLSHSGSGSSADPMLTSAPFFAPTQTPSPYPSQQPVDVPRPSRPRQHPHFEPEPTSAALKSPEATSPPWTSPTLVTSGGERSSHSSSSARASSRAGHGDASRIAFPSSFAPRPPPLIEEHQPSPADHGRTFASSTEDGDDEDDRSQLSGSGRNLSPRSSSSTSSQRAARAIAADRRALQSLLLDPQLEDQGGDSPATASVKERQRAYALERLQAMSQTLHHSPPLPHPRHPSASHMATSTVPSHALPQSAPAVFDPAASVLASSAGMDGSTVVLDPRGGRTPQLSAHDQGFHSAPPRPELIPRGSSRAGRSRDPSDGRRSRVPLASIPPSLPPHAEQHAGQPTPSDLGLAFRPEEVEAITRSHSRANVTTTSSSSGTFYPTSASSSTFASSASGASPAFQPPDVPHAAPPPPDRQLHNRTARPSQHQFSPQRAPATSDPSQSSPTAFRPGSVFSTNLSSSSGGQTSNVSSTGSSSSRKPPRGESPPFSPTTPAPLEPPPSGLRTMPAILRDEHDPSPVLEDDGDEIEDPIPHRRTAERPPPVHATDFAAPIPPNSAPPPVLHRQDSTIGGHAASGPAPSGPLVPPARIGRSVSSPGPNPPPVSVPPTLRRPSQSGHPKDLESMERLEWARKTGRTDMLSMRTTESGTVMGEGARDRWGNRWGHEGHVLSPVISERTERSHTSDSGASSQTSVATSRSRLSMHSNNSLLRRLQQSSVDAARTSSVQEFSASPERPHHARRGSSGVGKVRHPVAAAPVVHSSDPPSRPSTASTPQPPGGYPPSLRGSMLVESSPDRPMSTAQIPFESGVAPAVPPPMRSATPRRSSKGPTGDSRSLRSPAPDAGHSLRRQFAADMQVPPAPSLMAQISPPPHLQTPAPMQAMPAGVDAEARQARREEKRRRRMERERRISDAQKRDADVADRQAAKRAEREKREKMLMARDGILQQLADRPGDSKLIRDLGKLYLMNGSNEPTLKLAVRYLEQSIQIDNRDGQAWLFLARAWSLLLANHAAASRAERDQRASNASIGFRKAISISSQPNKADGNQYRLAYSEYLEEQGRYKEAAGVLQEAIDADNGDSEIWWELGRVMETWATKGEDAIMDRIDRLRSSCQAYQAACELEPTDQGMQDGLSDARALLAKMEQDASPFNGKATSRTVSPSIVGSAATAKDTQRVSPMQAPGPAFDRQATPKLSPANSVAGSIRSKASSNKTSSGQPPSPSQLSPPATKSLASPAHTRTHTPSSNGWRPPSPSSLPAPTGTPRLTSPAPRSNAHVTQGPPAIPPRPPSRSNLPSAFSSSTSSPTVARHSMRPASPANVVHGHPPQDGAENGAEAADMLADQDEYHFSLITEQLQSLINIDNERRAEIAALRVQFDENDKEADRRRAEVIDHIRRICVSPAHPGARPPNRPPSVRPPSRSAGRAGTPVHSEHHPARAPSRAEHPSGRAPSRAASRAGRHGAMSTPPVQQNPPPHRHGSRTPQPPRDWAPPEESLLAARPFSAIPAPIMGQDQAGFALNGIASILQLLSTSGPSPAPQAPAGTYEQ